MRKNKGFSLVELIIVIAIMAALVAILAPQYIRYIEKSREATCLRGMEDLAQMYMLDVILGRDTDSALMDEIAAESGATVDSPNHYSGICPSGGSVVATYNGNGTVNLTCSEHPGNKAPNFVPTLITTVNAKWDTIKRGAKTLKSYLNESGNKVIDSNAANPANLSASWAGLITQEMGGVLTDQTWKLVGNKATNTVTVYITKNGAIGLENAGDTGVEVTKYTYDMTTFEQTAQEDATVSVTKKTEASYTYATLEP